jgi:AAA domain
MTQPSFFQLRRLRVMRRGTPVYDQQFHPGVNIIRGENGSGKSTIADFLFYVLGGEFEHWKAAAMACDQVQAELVTQGGVLSLRRDVGKALTPMQVYFGPMSQAAQHGLDAWQIYSIRRGEGRESFSQILFRSSGIPEAQSQGASNITAHQILRLLYADQRTPAPFLFRYENFDTREIREAV